MAPLAVHIFRCTITLTLMRLHFMSTPSQSAEQGAAARADIHQPVRGALWMIGAMLSFTMMAIAGRELSGKLDTFEIMLYRSLIGVVIVLVVARSANTLHQIDSARLGLHVFRNMSHFIGQNLWFFALTVIPLSQLFAFEFSTPLWVALIAPFVLGERWTFTRVLACLLGFVGILTVARPDAITLGPATIAAALCAVGFAGAVVSTKLLSRTDSVTCILFWLVVLQSIFGLVCAGYDGDIKLPGAAELPWVLVVSFCGLIAHFCITTALGLAPATVVAPLDFLRLPLVSLVGFYLYNEELLYSVFLGAGLIFVANIMNIRAEQRRKKTTA